MSKVLFFLVLASTVSHNLIGSEHSKISASQQTMDSLLAPLSQEDKKSLIEDIVLFHKWRTSINELTPVITNLSLTQKEKVTLKEVLAKYNKQVEENKVKFDKNIALEEKINKTLKCSPLENLALLKNHGLSQEDYEAIGAMENQKDYSTLALPWPPLHPTFRGKGLYETGEQ